MPISGFIFQTIFIFSAIMDGWTVSCKGNGEYEFTDSISCRPCAHDDNFLTNFLYRHVQRATRGGFV